jgi:hypothetical protein
MDTRRRRVLQLGVATTGLALFTGHTPYRQWAVYRQRHLLIGTCRADPPTYPLGQRIAAMLAEALPQSRAQVSRAPDQRRLASLLGTGQFQLVLLSRSDAVELQQGGGLFVSVGPVAINALFRFGDYLLVCRPDFPDHQAYILTEVFSEHAMQIPGAVPLRLGEGPILAHDGARAYEEGLPMPPVPTN